MQRRLFDLNLDPPECRGAAIIIFFRFFFPSEKRNRVLIISVAYATVAFRKKKTSIYIYIAYITAKLPRPVLYRITAWDDRAEARGFESNEPHDTTSGLTVWRRLRKKKLIKNKQTNYSN